MFRAGPAALPLGRADLSYAGAGSSWAVVGRVAGVVRSRRDEGLAHWGPPVTPHTCTLTHVCVLLLPPFLGV